MADFIVNRFESKISDSLKYSLTKWRINLQITAKIGKEINEQYWRRRVSKQRISHGGLMAECRMFSMPSKIAISIATPADKAAWHVEGAAAES